MAAITTVAELEGVLGARPPGSDHKVIGVLDGHCEAIMARSPIAVVGTVAADGSPRTRTAGGWPGAVTVEGPTTVGLAGLATEDLVDGAPVGVLALVPGYGETLRVNGTLRLDGEVPQLEVAEAFVHCAKSVIRSKLWGDAVADAPGGSAAASSVEPGPLAQPAVVDLLGRAPFVALSSFDGGAAADVSPKGDPPGFLLALDDRTLAVPDRPGNLRTDTFRNVLADPTIGLLALVPGDDRVLEVRGTATLSSDADVLAPMAVNGKVPKLALVIAVDAAEVRVEPVLAAASLWDPARHLAPGDLPRATRIWLDHITTTEAAAAAFLPPEEVVAESIETDYRTNLY
ncbi:pyridoxamine 5'-phosphate oxidase family protein [Aquihabitans sp. G128]|uniref:pyridoxamine 5'-phosphate oxidase family protein n=1 Tax=Aquihabitans sp. G128 TaxID=2849779 RepID=UPI001C22D309|nr:pyridoxamine 5'-phosphate oxidase family protein [Aquihabitans sp. G128]QXC60912.1 pyridoxamine 5'-phosphate oxidase family protein [Aquihabitans sp. G128]